MRRHCVLRSCQVPAGGRRRRAVSVPELLAPGRTCGCNSVTGKPTSETTLPARRPTPSSCGLSRRVGSPAAWAVAQSAVLRRPGARLARAEGANVRGSVSDSPPRPSPGGNHVEPRDQRVQAAPPTPNACLDAGSVLHRTARRNALVSARRVKRRLRLGDALVATSYRDSSRLVANPGFAAHWAATCWSPPLNAHRDAAIRRVPLNCCPQGPG